MDTLRAYHQTLFKAIWIRAMRNLFLVVKSGQEHPKGSKKLILVIEGGHEPLDTSPYHGMMAMYQD